LIGAVTAAADDISEVAVSNTDHVSAGKDDARPPPGLHRRGDLRRIGSNYPLILLPEPRQVVTTATDGNETPMIVHPGVFLSI
jgi:hypothetical protein